MRSTFPRAGRVAGLAAGVAVLVAGTAVPSSAASTGSTGSAGRPAVAAARPAPAAAAVGRSRHGLGALPSRHTVSARSGLTRLHSLAMRTGDAAVPDAVDLSAYTVPVGDQGRVNSCTTWAIDYAMLGWYGNRQGHAGAPYAPMYAYSQMQAKYGWHDGGGFSEDAYRVAAEQGIDTQADYPQGSYDWQTLPTPAQHANAAAHKTVGFSYLYSTGAAPGTAARTAISAAVAAGHPVALGIVVYPGFFGLTAANHTFAASNVSGAPAGGHEILVVGYDAQGVRIQNSWGTGWGERGFANLTWDYVQGYSREATVMTGFATGGTPVAPVVPAPSVPAPVVSTASPASSLTTGGTRVTLTGTGFTGATSVTFGGRPASGVRVLNDTVLTAVTPAAAAGSAAVVVTGPRGSSTPAPFTVVTPLAVTGLTPDTGPAGGGTTVTLRGSGLSRVTAVRFRDRPATDLVLVDDSTLTVTAPAGAGGLAAVTVLSGTTGARGPGFRYQAPPRVTAVGPALVPAGSGTTLLLRGSGFTGATGVSFGGVAGTALQVLSDSALRVVTPELPLGRTAVQVLGAYGVSSAPVNALTVVPAPTITTVTSAPARGAQALTVTGTGFLPGTLAYVGGVRVGAVALSATSLRAVVPAALAGSTSIRVVTAGGAAEAAFG